MSAHINAAQKGEIAERILLPGDPLRAKYIAETYLENVKCYTEIRNMLGFTGTYKGVPVSVQGTGMGMPSMGIYSHELIHEYGCRKLIRVGTMGAFRKELGIGDIVAAAGASTDSNYIHTYNVPGNFAPVADTYLLKNVIDVSGKLGIGVTPGNVVSCDVFYEADPSWWERWAKIGILGVEMETAALYCNAAAGGVQALAIMTVSNHFVTGEETSAETRQNKFTDMMELALETIIL